MAAICHYHQPCQLVLKIRELLVRKVELSDEFNVHLKRPKALIERIARQAFFCTRGLLFVLPQQGNDDDDDDNIDSNRNFLIFHGRYTTHKKTMTLFLSLVEPSSRGILHFVEAPPSASSPNDA